MTNGTYPIDRKGSVTEGDTQAFVVYGGLGLFDGMPWQQTIASKVGLPPYWTPVRDMVLSQSLHMEDMWGSAIAKAVTKQAARGFTIDDSEDSAQRVERSQRLLLWYDGSVWSLGIQKWFQDFLLTDNGAFIEVERESNKPWARPVALWHLDSQHCWRTGNSEYPVTYWSGDGKWHKLRYDQVIAISDLPSPRREMKGIGFCSASRAWNTIVKLSGTQTYYREKITGSRTLAIHIVNGLSRQQLSDALAGGKDSQEQKGFMVYMGSLVIPTIKADTPPSVVTIPLAEVPDGFDVETERKDAYLIYANAIGVPVQDVQPLSGQGLGTGTQTIILAEEAEGYGVAAGVRALTQAINTIILPKATTFSPSNANDSRERLQKAQADKARADVLQVLVTIGALSALQAQNIAADEGMIPKEFVPNDQTGGGSLEDDEKPYDPVRQADQLILQTTQQGLVRKAYQEIRPYIDMPDQVLLDTLYGMHTTYGPVTFARLVSEATAVRKAAQRTQEWDAAMQWIEESQADAQPD